MGTSASNGGPKGSPPLVPSWYATPDQNQSTSSPSPDGTPQTPLPVPERTNDWHKAKSALTRLANHTSGSSRGKAGKSYVRSLGGSGSATRAAKQGVKVGSSFGSFLGNIPTNGFNSALSSIGLNDLVDKSPEDICAYIVNSIAPPGSTNDEAIAREALILTLDETYNRLLELRPDDPNPLQNLTPEDVKIIIQDYVANYVFTKWMYELGKTIEKGDVSVAEAIALETEIKDFIQLETREKSKGMDFKNGIEHDAEKLITEIFITAYSCIDHE